MFIILAYTQNSSTTPYLPASSAPRNSFSKQVKSLGWRWAADSWSLLNYLPENTSCTSTSWCLDCAVMVNEDVLIEIERKGMRWRWPLSGAAARANCVSLNPGVNVISPALKIDFSFSSVCLKFGSQVLNHIGCLHFWGNFYSSKIHFPHIFWKTF